MSNSTEAHVLKKFQFWIFPFCVLWLSGLTAYVVFPPKPSETVLDDREGSFLRIGRYEYGWTFTTPFRLEMHPKDEFSISCYGKKCLPRFQVRNIGDTEGAVWINGNNRIGSQFGPLIFAFGSFNSGGDEIARFDRDGTFILKGDLVLDGMKLSERLTALEAKLQ